jgi:uncharacterized protein (DUF1015 family)
MAQIFPFRAYRYNPQKVEPARVLTQPYDKITPEMQQKYAAQSPYNLIAVEKGLAHPGDTPADSVYTRAATALHQWIAQNILLKDAGPSFYAYFQEFAAPGSSERRVRQGLIALGKIEDYSAGVVYRHERTLAGPKADRLELLRHTRAHTGQLFMLYDDPSLTVDAILAQAAATQPDTGLRDEYGVMHKLWRISDPQAVTTIAAALAEKKLVIADGHHRYETALAYRNERRAQSGGAVDPDAPWERVMMTLVNARSKGLVILPTHRVVSGLPAFDLKALQEKLAPHFEVREIKLSKDHAQRADAAHKALDDAGRSGRAIGAYAGGESLVLLTLKPQADLARALPNVSPRQRALDVVLLHELILAQGLGISAEAVRQEANIRYEREIAAAMEAVQSGRAQVAFLLNPVSVRQVMELATQGEVLPQKSTDFCPKLLSGITIYRLEEDR